MIRKLKLINWVREQHNGQLIKETNTPYFEHLLAVANRVAASAPLTYEIGLCHDVEEKTPVINTILLARLIEFGYGRKEAEHICSCVAELTRHYTKAANPLPKQERKALEEERLLGISADAQTVKYADLSYNADWMMSHDRHHASDYIQRKFYLIQEMTAGDAALRQEVIAELRKILTEL